MKTVQKLTISRIGDFKSLAKAYERGKLRKKGFLGIKTYSPFRDVHKKPSFRGMLTLSEFVATAIGAPKKDEGRPRVYRVYNWNKIAAALLCKGTMGFRALENRLK